MSKKPSQAKKYKSQYGDCEAIKWDGNNLPEIFAFTKAQVIEHDFVEENITIQSTEIQLEAAVGDYILKKDEKLEICKAFFFKENYFLA